MTNIGDLIVALIITAVLGVVVGSTSLGLAWGFAIFIIAFPLYTMMFGSLEER